MFKFLKRLFQVKKVQEIKIGQIWVDKEWKDTIIEVTAINDTKTSIRCRFAMVKGDYSSTSYRFNLSPNTLRNSYELKTTDLI